MDLCDVIQEALQKHAVGIHYREHNAGPAIDGDMSDLGKLYILVLVACPNTPCLITPTVEISMKTN